MISGGPSGSRPDRVTLLAEVCGCCGRTLPGRDDPPATGDVRVGTAWLRGRLLIPDDGLPSKLSPTHADMLRTLGKRPGGVSLVALAGALGATEGCIKVQMRYLRDHLAKADLGVNVPLQRAGRGNHAIYRLA